MRPIPRKAVSLIKSFESCELTAYKDIAGVWTIGWGNTSHAKPGLVIDQTTADLYFNMDATNVVREIARVLKPEILAALTDDQYGALCSFAFNLGVKPKSHAIWSLINSGQFDRVPSRLLLYNKAVVNGKLVPVKGLTRRRQAEAAMWQEDGEDIALTAHHADVQPTPILQKGISRSKRLWLGFTGAVAGAGNWLVEHVKTAGEWAGQLQTLVAPQVTKSEFLAHVSSALAIVAVAAGAAIMMLQAKAQKDLKT